MRPRLYCTGNFFLVVKCSKQFTFAIYSIKHLNKIILLFQQHIYQSSTNNSFKTLIRASIQIFKLLQKETNNQLQPRLKFIIKPFFTFYVLCYLRHLGVFAKSIRNLLENLLLKLKSRIWQYSVQIYTNSSYRFATWNQ